MYLPYAKGEKSQHCSESIDNSIVSGNNVNGGDYVIKQTAEPTDASALTIVWNNEVVRNKETLLDHVFSGGDDLCERVKAKLSKNVFGQGGFKGFAAVACGKKFVWYQLGYKYFAAAATGGDARAVSSATVDSYNPNCGQIIFFP
ncbi:hypothetical protein AAVH_23101 [Aphelenchoides avenae]|nr:hypothetical protein AAVH_23101 [Aphelenchus avenae]